MITREERTKAREIALHLVNQLDCGELNELMSSLVLGEYHWSLYFEEKPPKGVSTELFNVLQYWETTGEIPSY